MTTLWPDIRDNRDALVERSMLDTRGSLQVNCCDNPTQHEVALASAVAPAVHYRRRCLRRTVRIHAAAL